MRLPFSVNDKMEYYKMWLRLYCVYPRRATEVKFTLLILIGYTRLAARWLSKINVGLYRRDENNADVRSNRK